MKSNLKISLAAVGILSTVLVSAAAAPAASRIATVDYIVEEQDAMAAEKDFVEEIEPADISNEGELLSVKDETLRPSNLSSRQQSASTLQSSKAVSSEASKAASSQSSKVTAPSSAAISSAQAALAAASAAAYQKQQQLSAQAAQAPVVNPTVIVDKEIVPAANRDNAGNEILIYRTGTTIYKLTTKDALKRIVSNEVGEQISYEAIKAQVVAAHTYVKYYNDQGQVPTLGSKTSYKVGGKIDKAVEEVYNVISTFNGKAIFSPYHSSSAGRTQSSKEVWGGARAYLVSVESKYEYNKDVAKKTFSAEAVKQKIISSLGVTPSGDPSTWFRFLSAENGGFTSGGYVNKIYVGGKLTTGVKVRTMMNLRSAYFGVTYSNGNFVFNTVGYGHGVGLSQCGAHYYAVYSGWNYQQIMCHYFSGTHIAVVA